MSKVKMYIEDLEQMIEELKANECDTIEVSIERDLDDSVSYIQFDAVDDNGNYCSDLYTISVRGRRWY